MPKDTFFSLPEDKRKRIIDLALDEFAAKPFHQASLSRIVERAGIAKGSMYQYFEDKFDLYIYLLGLVGEAKMKGMAEYAIPLGADPDVFDLLIAATQAGLSVAREDPRLLSVANNLLRETDDQFVDRVMSRLGGASMTQEMFQKAIDKGQIDRRVSPKMAEFTLSAITWQMGQEMAAGRLPLDQVLPFVREVFDVLEFGMRPRAERGRQSGGERHGEQDDDKGS
jgi:AcrR family transcriptional regulator